MSVRVVSQPEAPSPNGQQMSAHTQPALRNLLSSILLSNSPSIAASLLQDMFEDGRKRETPLSELLLQPFDELHAKTAFEYEILRCDWQEPSSHVLLDLMLENITGDRATLKALMRRACLRRSRDANSLFQYMLRKIGRTDNDSSRRGELSIGHVSQESLHYEIVRNDLDDERGFDMSFSIMDFITSLKKAYNEQPHANNARERRFVPGDPPPYDPDPVDEPSISLQFMASSHAWSLDIGRHDLQLQLLDGEAVTVDARATVIVQPLSGSTSPFLTAREMEMFDYGGNGDEVSLTEPEEVRTLALPQQQTVLSFNEIEAFDDSTQDIHNPPLEFLFPIATLYPLSRAEKHAVVLRHCFSHFTLKESAMTASRDDLHQECSNSRYPTGFDDPNLLNDGDELLLRLRVNLHQIPPLVLV